MASGFYGSGFYRSGFYDSGFYGQQIVVEQEPSSGGGSMWGRDEDKRVNDDDKIIMGVIKKFLEEVNLEL